MNIVVPESFVHISWSRHISFYPWINYENRRCIFLLSYSPLNCSFFLCDPLKGWTTELHLTIASNKWYISQSRTRSPGALSGFPGHRGLEPHKYPTPLANPQHLRKTHHNPLLATWKWVFGQHLGVSPLTGNAWILDAYKANPPFNSLLGLICSMRYLHLFLF